MEILEKIKKLAKNVAEPRGLEIVEVKLLNKTSRGLVKVFVAKSQGVSIKDCSDVSRDLGVLFDAENLFQQPYTLEVSSPGLDRPLRTLNDFKRNIGRQIRLTYRNQDKKTVELEGFLREVLGSDIVMEKEGENIPVALDSVIHAKVKVVFK